MYANIFHQYNPNTCWTQGQLGSTRGLYPDRDFTCVHAHTHTHARHMCVRVHTHACMSNNFNGHPKKCSANARTMHFLLLFTQLNEIGWHDHSQGENQSLPCAFTMTHLRPCLHPHKESPLETLSRGQEPFEHNNREIPTPPSQAWEPCAPGIDR